MIRRVRPPQTKLRLNPNRFEYYLRYKDRTNIRRHEKSVELLRIAGGCCVRCGYNECDAALDFHHINPRTKQFNVKTGLTRSMASLKSEIAKCVLLCANCHRLVHATKDIKWLKVVTKAA